MCPKTDLAVKHRQVGFIFAWKRNPGNGVTGLIFCAGLTKSGLYFSCCFPSSFVFIKRNTHTHTLIAQHTGGVLIIPAITYRSHELTGVPPGCCGSGCLAVRRCAEAEALEGAQQTEAAVLGFGFWMDDLGQLMWQRHSPTNRPQMVRVLGVLMEKQTV